MKYKLIGVDFDGTLLRDDKSISKNTIDYLKKVRKHNIKLVAVTGRTIESTKNATDINLFDYLILNNGSILYDVVNKKIIYEEYLDKKYAKTVTELTDNYSKKVDYCTFKNYYTYKGKVPSDVKFILRVNSVDEVDENISKINIFLEKTKNIEEEKQLIEKVNDNAKVIIMQDSDSDKQWIVITPKGISKEKGLEKLGEIININLDEMIFFGDGLNDIEVISAVGMGIAMGNALKEVKEKAKDITKTNNEDGIAYYIKKKILKEK